MSIFLISLDFTYLIIPGDPLAKELYFVWGPVNIQKVDQIDSKICK